MCWHLRLRSPSSIPQDKTIVYIFTRPYGNGLSMYYSLVFFLTFIYTKRVISIIERLALRRLAHN